MLAITMLHHPHRPQDIRLGDILPLTTHPPGYYGRPWTCGFNDLSHFNNVFRSRLDMTPSELRQGAAQARIRPV